MRLIPPAGFHIDAEVARLRKFLPDANRSNVLRALVHAAMQSSVRPEPSVGKPRRSHLGNTGDSGWLLKGRATVTFL
jgi:hypothetical protein